VSAISVRELSAGYGGEAVIDDISFELGQQQLLAILGPSGSGKSTLLKTIAGFLTPMAGSITLDGVLVSDTESPRSARKTKYWAGPARRFPLPTP